MESQLVEWADLPADLLAIISDRLEDADDIRRFRWICQSWRSSTKPLPNKICPFFPRRLSDSKLVVASAVFLVRPLTPNSTKASAWIVSVQEPETGNLLLRNALTGEPIAGSPGHSIDLSRWSFTRIATSHLLSGKPVAFIPNSIPVIVRVRLVNPGLVIRRVYDDARLVIGAQLSFDDIVNFNGCIYGVDMKANVYIIDDTTGWSMTPPKLIVSNFLNLNSLIFIGAQLWFVVSDGDLYLVAIPMYECGSQDPECEVYKLAVEADMSYNVEKVEDLGDRVFFILNDSPFSVSAQHLPPPLVGNCVVFERYSPWVSRFEVYVSHLGRKDKPGSFVYSALFNPGLFLNKK